MKNIPILCSCCGTEITKPQYYEGKAYGYTCILKVAPGFKRSAKEVLRLPVMAQSKIDMPCRVIKVACGEYSAVLPVRQEREQAGKKWEYYDIEKRHWLKVRK